MCDSQLRVGGSFVVTCERYDDNHDGDHRFSGEIQGWKLDLRWKEPQSSKYVFGPTVIG